MKTRELLTQLSKLENGLDQFSYKELKVEEAAELKKSFDNFKNGLEAKVFGEDWEKEDYFDLNTLKKSELQLVANVSHEVRTPLNGIMGFIDLLNETPLNPAQTEIATALTTASNYLMNIINELLEFSKIASGNESFEQVHFNISNVVNELIFLSKTLVVDKTISITSSIDENVPQNLIGDPSKLSQILMNLMGNAVKFVEQGEINLIVSTKERIDGQVLLEFSIADTGIGISDDNLKRIFESYQQAEPDTNKKYGGSGLGLSIVKQIIEKLGGSIDVKSALGVGTTFTFQIPYHFQQHIPKKGLANSVDDYNNVDIKGYKILVIEDNSLNQKLFQNQIDSWGSEVLVASNGVKGVQMLEENHFDLVLLDLRLPVIDGFEITRVIRNHHSIHIKNTPIIAVSADFTTDDERKCTNLGINDFLLKPYSSKELAHKIQLQVEKSKKEASDSTKTSITLQDSDEEQLVDLQPLFKECQNNVELMEELIRLFRVNILEFIGKTKTHLQVRNFQGVDFAAHKIKSSLQMMHANTLTEISKELSTISKSSKNLGELETLYSTFLELFPKADEQIEKSIQELKKET